MTTRRDFIKMTASASLASLPLMTFSEVGNNISKRSDNSKMIWANLLHLSTNMWEDHPYVKDHVYLKDYSDIVKKNIHRDDFKYNNRLEAIMWGMRAYRPFLVFDQMLWDTTLKQMADSGMNMVVIDLGDGIQYESHPEIAVKNAWSVDKLKAELDKIRRLGMEPIPKLNFATTHDAWLGEYGRMVSTKKYYTVCRNLIREVIDLFDTPRFFHLGMDEETAKHQLTHNLAVVRQHDLWWHDLFFYINEVESKGVRPWIWADYGWNHKETFFKKMPKSVLQSNWYYAQGFDLSNMNELTRTKVDFYNQLEDHGYDQVPTGSNFSNNFNMQATVEYCKKNIASERLFGFMTAPWLPMLPPCSDSQSDAIKQIANAKKSFY